MITVGKIRIIPFFHGFEDPQIKAILPFFEEKQITSGEAIIHQGKVNTKLFFLIGGSVSIVVNDRVLVDLATAGQVFGEMSLASHSGSTATVRAKENCTFLVFSFEEMRKSVDAQLKDGILKNFYKGTMEILAAKLLDANKRNQ
jgi:CRP/FNR family transcriptional regulator, cyclic AMP receptor protein